jgi:uncharacterized protein YraI
MTTIAKLAGAAAILLTSGVAASAASAIATTDLNVRSGQGTNYRVVGTIPGGAEVDARGCGDGWCYISEYGGYASARYLDRSYASYGAPQVYGSYSYGAVPYYGPSYYAGPRLSFGFGFGSSPYWGHRHWGHRHW